MIPVILSWSGGKDSTLALRELRRSGRYRVTGLLTTVSREHDRISIHGVRRELLEAQASAVGLPLTLVHLPVEAGNAEYEAEMGCALSRVAAEGTETVAFGDLFLCDVRRYRERLVARSGLRAVFPIWGRPTAALAREFIDSGYEATITCVDTDAIDGGFAGRRFDHRLLRDLPASADPCGENGEFHTFVTGGPGMDSAVAVRPGGTVVRDGRFVFSDLLPA